MRELWPCNWVKSPVWRYVLGTCPISLMCLHGCLCVAISSLIHLALNYHCQFPLHRIFLNAYRLGRSVSKTAEFGLMSLSSAISYSWLRNCLPNESVAVHRRLCLWVWYSSVCVVVHPRLRLWNRWLSSLGNSTKLRADIRDRSS